MAFMTQAVEWWRGFFPARKPKQAPEIKLVKKPTTPGAIICKLCLAETHSYRTYADGRVLCLNCALSKR